MSVKNHPRRWRRRAFLGATGAAALTLPFWRTLRGEAQGAVFPKRLLLVFSPNGTWPGEFFPTGGERDFTFGRILAPLEPYRNKIMVLEGVHQRITSVGPGDGHQKGMGCLWTGVELLPGDNMGGCDSCPPVSFASGPSVDQHVALTIGNETPFRSVELGVDNGNNENVWTRMIYDRPGNPLPPEDDPLQAFGRLFGNLDRDPTEGERLRTLRSSVLDFAQEDFTRLQSRLGTADRQQLDSHLTSVRELERRLQAMPNIGASCVIPNIADPGPLNDDSNNPAVLQAMTDMTVMAFACDLTRVASLQWNNSVGQASFPWLGFNDRHHDLSHEGDSNADAVEKIIRINEWYAQQFAELLRQLDSIQEGDGTLLDNTLVVWGNELGKGNSHTRNNIPWVLAGGGAGAIEMGRYLDFDGASHCDLLTAICHAMGVEESFGDSRFATGPLV